MSAIDKLAAQVRELGFAVHVERRPTGAEAMRFRTLGAIGGRPWGWVVFNGGHWSLCTVIEMTGFKRLTSESLLPYLRGPEAYASYLAKRAEQNRKAAETKAANEAFAAQVGPRIAELLACGVPPRYVHGGLTGDAKHLLKIADKMVKAKDKQVPVKQQSGG